MYIYIHIVIFQYVSTNTSIRSNSQHHVRCYHQCQILSGNKLLQPPSPEGISRLRELGRGWAGLSSALCFAIVVAKQTGSARCFQ